jgi:hypothetical protein
MKKENKVLEIVRKYLHNKKIEYEKEFYDLKIRHNDNFELRDGSFASVYTVVYRVSFGGDYQAFYLFVDASTLDLLYIMGAQSYIEIDRTFT